MAQLTVLMIDDNNDYARLIEARLSVETDPAFRFIQAGTLKQGLESIEANPIDLLLLDLNLPDSRGLETFVRVRTLHPLMPVVIVSGMSDEDISIEAVRLGAQDYVVKGEIDGKFFPRIIKHNIERSRIQAELQKTSLVDELTGLYNRRGLMTLVRQHVKLAKRNQKGFFVILVDLDRLKRINDRWGHSEGDQALIDASKILRDSFRGSDIISRIGGDEFVVVAIEANPESLDVIRRHIQKHIEAHNSSSGKDYVLRLSVGSAYYDPKKLVSFEDILKEADQLMYQEKAAIKNQAS